MEKADKQNNTDESDFSENEILDLNVLKPFEFESKTNIRVINSSSSDDQKQPLVVVPQKRCSFLLGLHIIRSSHQTSLRWLLSDDEKEGIEYKVKQIRNREW